MSEDKSKIELLMARKTTAQALYEKAEDEGPKVRIFELITELEGLICQEQYKQKLLLGEE
jgi:hypothetical protein